MIGLVIVTHGKLASALLVAMEHVVGHQSQTSCIEIGAHDNMEVRRQDIADAVANNDIGDGVIILTDLCGGTPSNLAISLLSNRVEVVWGINLPMLIRCDMARKNEPLHAAAASIRDAGRKYIDRAADVLGDNFEPPSAVGMVSNQGPHNAICDSLEHMAIDLERLRTDLRSQLRQKTTYSGIGHNLPPPAFTIDDNHVLEEGEIASKVAANELAKDQPNPKILQLCIAALKRVMALLKQLSVWSLSLGDTFVKEGVKSTGKALGPALVAAATAAGLSGKVAELIEYLKGVTGF